MLTKKECTNLCCYLFLVLYRVFSYFIFINILKPDVPSALKKIIQVSETLMRLTKELHFLNYCSHKIDKFLIQNIDLYNKHRNHAMSWVSFSKIYF